MRKPLPNALDIDFKGGLISEVIPHASVALLIETAGVMASWPQPRSTSRKSVHRAG